MQITIENVRKSYGKVTAIEDLSLRIPSGSTFGLLGTNGAGKTTLFRLLVGHDQPNRGRISVGGMDVSESSVRVREQVGYLPDQIGFPGDLTGTETLQFHAAMHEVPKGNRVTRIDEVLSLVGLSDSADRRVSGYSNGMGRRLGLAAVLIGRPTVLVLDEPTAGLDPRGVAAFHRIIDRIGEKTGSTVIFASHALAEVERLCDEVAILHEGRLVCVGSVTDVIGQVDQRTTLRFVPMDETDGRTIANSAQRHGSVSQEDGAVTVTCSLPRVFNLLSELAEIPMESMTVEGPTLDRAFRSAVEDAEVHSA